MRSTARRAPAPGRPLVPERALRAGIGRRVLAANRCPAAADAGPDIRVIASDIRVIGAAPDGRGRCGGRCESSGRQVRLRGWLRGCLRGPLRKSLRERPNGLRDAVCGCSNGPPEPPCVGSEGIGRAARAASRAAERGFETRISESGAAVGALIGAPSTCPARASNFRSAEPEIAIGAVGAPHSAAVPRRRSVQEGALGHYH